MRRVADIQWRRRGPCEQLGRTRGATSGSRPDPALARGGADSAAAAAARAARSPDGADSRSNAAAVAEPDLRGSKGHTFDATRLVRGSL